MSYSHSPDHPSPSTQWVTELLKTLGVCTIVILFCLLLLVRDPGLFWHDDFQSQYLGAFRDIARAWEQGELPLISRSSWFGGALAGEYQYGIFSIFIQLVNYFIWQLHLSLPTTAATYSMIHLGVLAAGAFRLARQRDLRTELALIVALVACFNGWIICWGASSWVPGLASFTWLPWVWWGLEFALRSQRVWRFVPAGIFIYLTLTAGWPFTDLMIALVSAWLGLKTLFQQRSLRSLWPLVAAWLMGIGLASPALLMLVEYNQATLRQGLSQKIWHWITPLSSFLGMVLPSYLSVWDIGIVKIRRSIDLANGLVPVVFLLISTVRLGKPFLKSLIWEWGLLALCFFLAVSPGISNFQYSFRWLPLLHLVMVLIAVEGWDWLQRKQLNPKQWCNNWGIWATLLVLLVWAKGLWIELVDLQGSSLGFLCAINGLCSKDIRNSLLEPALGRIAPTTTLTLGLKLCLICISWAALIHILRAASPLIRYMPVLLTVLCFWLTYTHVPILQTTPYWALPETIRSFQPFNPNIRYLSLYLHEDIYGNIFSRTILETEPPLSVSRLLQMGNLSMYSGLEFINGYSSQRLYSLGAVFKFSHMSQTAYPVAAHIIKTESGREGLLQLMGVDGLVLSPNLVFFVPMLEENGWQLVAEEQGAVVLHRIGAPSPRVQSLDHIELRDSKGDILWPLISRPPSPVPLRLYAPDQQTNGQVVEFDPVTTRIVQESHRKVVVEVQAQSTRSPSMVLFSRSWYPGYRAYFNGKPIPVKVLNLLMPAVELPPGASGELVLDYFPLSLQVGLYMAGATLITVPASLILLNYLHQKQLAKQH